MTDGTATECYSCHSGIISSKIGLFQYYNVTKSSK